MMTTAPEHGYYVVPGAILPDGKLHMVVDQTSGAQASGVCGAMPMPQSIALTLENAVRPRSPAGSDRPLEQIVQILSRTITARESTPSIIAFETAAMPHYAGLVRRLTLVLGSTEDAQDVAQEAYFRGFRSWSRFDGADVRAGLYTIALRLAFNHLRSRRRGLSAWRCVEPKSWPDPADPGLAAALPGPSYSKRAPAYDRRRLHPGRGSGNRWSSSGHFEQLAAPWAGKHFAGPSTNRQDESGAAFPPPRYGVE